MIFYLVKVVHGGNLIYKDQVLKMHKFIENENPEIYAWFILKVEYAVEKGWLDSS